MHRTSWRCWHMEHSSSSSSSISYAISMPQQERIERPLPGNSCIHIWKSLEKWCHNTWLEYFHVEVIFGIWIFGWNIWLITSFYAYCTWYLYYRRDITNYVSYRSGTKHSMRLWPMSWLTAGFQPWLLLWDLSTLTFHPKQHSLLRNLEVAIIFYAIVCIADALFTDFNRNSGNPWELGE